MREEQMDTKKGLPILGIIMLLSATIWWGIYSFSPPEYPKTQRMIEDDKFIAGLAEKSGGDFSKLSPEEQKKLNQMSMGHGQNVLSSLKK
jgi:hypothetical protein